MILSIQFDKNFNNTSTEFFELIIKINIINQSSVKELNYINI